MSRSFSLFIGSVLLAVSISHCAVDSTQAPTGQTETSPRALRLELGSRSDGPGSIEILLHHSKSPELAGPRVMEAFLRFSGPIRYLSSAPGEATIAAGKALVVQEKQPGLLRIMAFSATSISELDSGLLATLRFEKTGTGTATLEILTDRPIFAPAETNQGLLVSDPLRIAL